MVLTLNTSQSLSNLIIRLKAGDALIVAPSTLLSHEHTCLIFDSWMDRIWRGRESFLKVREENSWLSRNNIRTCNCHSCLDLITNFVRTSQNDIRIGASSTDSSLPSSDSLKVSWHLLPPLALEAIAN